MSINVVSTDLAPKAIGPYSQAISANGFLFVSGQIPLNPQTMELVDGIEAQTRQALTNLSEVLLAGGSDLEHVVKVNVFLKDMNDFNTVNGIYAEFFQTHKPARALVEVARLPKDVLIEIECTALIKK